MYESVTKLNNECVCFQSLSFHPSLLLPLLSTTSPSVSPYHVHDFKYLLHENEHVEEIGEWGQR